MPDTPTTLEALRESGHTPNTESLSYTEAALVARNIDFLEAKAAAGMEEISVQNMFNAIASVFEKWASQDLMDRFREKLGAIGYLCFTEGALQAWIEISDQQRLLGAPLPSDAHAALVAENAALKTLVLEAMKLLSQSPTRKVYPAQEDRLAWKDRARSALTKSPSIDIPAAGGEG